jgi:hypothetical protein
VAIDKPVTESLSDGHPPWNVNVLADLADLAYTRAVVFTDGAGRSCIE